MCLLWGKRNYFQHETEEAAIATIDGQKRQSIPGFQEKFSKIQKVQKTKKFMRTQRQHFYRKCLQSTSRDHAQTEQQWNAKEEQTPQNKELGLKLSLRASFGFTFDPDLSMQKNVNNIIIDMPSDLYFTQALNIAYHNLCLTKQLPISIKLLLGLSLKFIPNDKFTHGIQDFDIDRFSRDSNLCMFFAHSVDSYKRPPFWVPSDWQPQERDRPILFRTRISNFIENAFIVQKEKKLY